MAATDHKVFNFSGATAELGIQPASAPAGSFPLLCGIDGRYGDVLRRYPGHKRYPDTNAALGCTPTAAVMNPTFVQPFEIQKQGASLDKIRGFVVYDEFNGACEFWYKFSTDADGVIRKYNLLTTGGLIFRTLTNPAVDHKPQPVASGVGELPAVFNGTTYTAQELNAFCVHTDQHGTNLYAAGIFRFAGDRHCQCIAKWDGTRWSPLPDAFFNGGAILTLCSHQYGLFVGGAFTSKGSTAGGQDTNFKYCCVWDSEKWYTLAGGTDGAVRSIISTGTGLPLILGGAFANVETTPGATPNEASPFLAKWTPSTSSWTVSGITYTGGTAVFSLVLDGSTVYVGGDWDQAGGVANTDHLFTMTTSFGSVTALGSGIPDGIVYTLKMTNSVLYAGGSFTSAGGVANTNLIARYRAGAWESVDGGLTSGTVRSIDTRDMGGGVYQVLVAGHALVVGGNDRGLWYNVLTGAASWGGWTGPVDFITSTLNISAQIEWDSWRYYGGQDMGSALSLNPLSAPLDANDDPTAVGPKIDVAYHDRYIFLLASNGVKKTIYWDAPAAAFKVASFGPGLMYADGVPDAAVSSVNSSGRLATGNYVSKYRYFDPDRVRWTALSAENDEHGDTSPWYLIVDQQTAANELNKAPDGFVQSELFSTISSTATNILAGGTIYRVARGATNSTTRRSTIWHGAPTFVDYGNGEYHWALSDDSIPDPSRTYDIDIEETGELGDVYAVACHQGMTFALEGVGGLLRLRWSNSFRTEWENFAPLNGYQTGIRSEAAWSCRFIAAGDFLYLLGGDQVFLIQRIGVSVRIIKVFSGLSIIHRQAAHVVGNQLFVLTQQGLLVIDPRSSQGAILRRLDRIFWDRWRGFLEPSSTSKSASICYDAQMECLYVHNNALKEAVCLWLNTGKVSLLLNTATDMCCSFPDIDSDQGERAYFFTNRRWFAVPQWTPTQAATMQGDFLQDDSDSDTLLVKYNWPITTVTHGATGAPNYGGIALTQLLMAPTAPAAVGTDSPFTTDGATANAVCVAPMAIMALTGTQKGKIFQVVANSDRILWLAADNVGLVAGDVIAMAPVTTFVLGSMIWNERGAINPSARKLHKGASITVSRLSSTGELAQLSPPTGASLVQFGVCRQDNFTDSEPSSSVLLANSDRGGNEYRGPHGVHVVEPYSEVDGPLDQALDTDKEASNWTRKSADGTIVFPFMTFRTSNYNVEVLFWDVLGTVENSSIPGPGTL